MFLSLLVGLASCKNELLEPPDFSDRGAYSSTEISAPENVKATQGGYRLITVSWASVENAVKYEVYTSKISTVEFEKRTETNGNDKTSVEIKEDADVLAYFKVKAYDKNGNASEFSKTCHGTTLGTPVITNVIQDELGRSATVRWWCGAYFNANTYKNDVEYSVALYADAEGTTLISEQKMDGSSIKMSEDALDGEISAECTFTGLSPKTTYYYQVKAYLKGTPDKVEASAILDKETARRLIPNPVEDLVATQGISDKEVTLSFILPDFVDVKESSDVFLKKPLYFEISRAEVEYTASDEIDEETGRPIYKEGNKPLTDYTVIATIKAAASSDWEKSGNMYYFDCTNESDSTSSKKLTLEKTDSVESNEGDAEPYIPGYKLTFTDTTAQRGDDKSPVYSYKITSYADVNKKVTSDESVAKATGWLIGNLKLDLSAKKVHYDYADAEKKQISKITVKFSCMIEDYGKGYTYIVTQSAVDKDDKPILDETIVKVMDINELKDFSVVYDLSTTDEGFYSYKFYIAPKGTESLSDPYYYCYDKYRTKTAVVNRTDKLLEIEQFYVEDGYSDKFVIKWSYNPDYTYRLSWTPVVNGIEQDEESLFFGAPAESNENNEEGVVVINSIGSDGIATFDHGAESGDVRKYTMQITSGFGIPKEFERPSYTLGTAVVEQDGYAYDTITIKWNKVQKADSYTLEAWYDDNSDNAGYAKYDAGGETSHTFQPEYVDATTGRVDAARAGADVHVRVTARSGRDSTVSEAIPARLIGPAEVDARVNEEASEESISVSWREVKGANGYLIRRVMYDDAAMTSVANDSEVTYYCDANGKITLQLGGDVTNRATVRPSGAGFTLTDEYMESDATSDFADYQKAQAKISWGLPFCYIVLPVLEKDDFDFIREFECEGKVKYKNLSPTDATATWGYGLNLVADKATSGTTQNIKWDEPYNAQRPVVYRRTAGSSGNFEELTAPFKGEKTAALTIDSNDCYNAFEYIVKYYSESELYYSDDIALPPSLNEEIEASKTEYVTPAGNFAEQNNKGYLLTLEGFNAEVSAKDYYEKIYWTEWSYKNRAVGPDSMTISVKNHNIGDYFHKIVTVEKAYVTNPDSINVLDDTDNDIKNDITAEIEGSKEHGYKHNAVLIAPAGIAAGTKGTTDGYLKVLRDYKHYYTFTLERDGIIPVKYEDYEKNNNVKDAYRQITNEEMVRAATLAMSIGFKNSYDARSGTQWSAAAINKNTYTSPAGGTCKFDTVSDTDVHHKLTYSNFTPVLKSKSGQEVTFLTITGYLEGLAGFWTIDCPKTYNGSDIMISSSDGFYSGTISFNSLEYKSTNRISISQQKTKTEFGNLTPFPFQKNSSKFLNDNVEWQ